MGFFEREIESRFRDTYSDPNKRDAPFQDKHTDNLQAGKEEDQKPLDDLDKIVQKSEAKIKSVDDAYPMSLDKMIEKRLKMSWHDEVKAVKDLLRPKGVVFFDIVKEGSVYKAEIGADKHEVARSTLKSNGFKMIRSYSEGDLATLVFEKDNK